MSRSLAGGVLCLALLGQKKPGEVTRGVHDAPDFNILGQRLIKDAVVVEAAHAPAPHARQPGVVNHTQGLETLGPVAFHTNTLRQAVAEAHTSKSRLWLTRDLSSRGRLAGLVYAIEVHAGFQASAIRGAQNAPGAIYTIQFALGTL